MKMMLHLVCVPVTFLGYKEVSALTDLNLSMTQSLSIYLSTFIIDYSICFFASMSCQDRINSYDCVHIRDFETRSSGVGYVNVLHIDSSTRQCQILTQIMGFDLCSIILNSHLTMYYSSKCISLSFSQCYDGRMICTIWSFKMLLYQ